MMYIIRQSDKEVAARAIRRTPDPVEPKSYNWHTGERRPLAKEQPFEDVCEVYADGHELEHIRKLHTNLPDVPTARSIVWRGDFAQFIYDHLPANGSVSVNETAHYR